VNTLIVIIGPTGVGKTEFSLSLAETFSCPIVSADSRQIYRELPIGTAAPTIQEQQRIRHYFVGTHSLTEDFNAGQYEQEAIRLLEQLFQQHQYVILTGGSMLYIDAVCNGLDDIPHIPDKLKERLQTEYQQNGIGWLQEQLQAADPDYYQIVDQQNPQRMMHALGVSLASQRPYSSFRTGQKKNRPFRILKIGLTRPREALYERIDRRVEQMLQMGLEQEARRVYPLREYNSLNTVGYKELFAYFNGSDTYDNAVRLIKQNTRHYAKRQMTWFRRSNDIHWFDAQTITINDIYPLL